MTDWASPPLLIATLAAFGWTVVAAAGGGTFGALEFDTTGAAAAVALSVVLAAVIRSAPSDLLAPYAVAVLMGTAATAAAGSEGSVVPMLAGALVVALAALRARRPRDAAILLVPLVVAGADLVDAGGPSATLAVALAAAGVMAAGRDWWPAAVGVLALAAAAAGSAPGLVLLAAAAVVVTAIDHPVALLVALPGAVVAVDAAVSGAGFGITGVATGVVASVAWGLRSVRQPPRLAWRHLPAAFLGAGAALTAHLWTWAGIGTVEAELLRRTALGLVLAAAAATAAVVLGWVSGQVGAPRPDPTA